MKWIDHTLICGCEISVEVYHDWVDDVEGIEDATIVYICPVHRKGWEDKDENDI